jgi:hypothetical protein
MEPAFGGLFGWIAGERLGLGGFVGSALILAAMLVAEFASGSAAGPGPQKFEPGIEGPPVVLGNEPE